MTEFITAYHHNVVMKRRNRLIALMMLDGPNEVLACDTSDAAASLRQYLRQYTYIDYRADDWLDRLLYALPIDGLLSLNNNNNNSTADDLELVRDM